MFVTAVSSMILLLPVFTKNADAASLPNLDSVLESYKQNPYIRFYEGAEGIAWTTIHPGGYSVTSNGTYIYGGGNSIYRGVYQSEVIPKDVVSRKQLQGPLPAGHHYYAAPLDNTIIPVGKWVLSHVDSRCVHGPFNACRDYEYYGISGLTNLKCGESYDSGWIAYCADCGKAITGYVYTSDDCVSRINYIFAGDENFSKTYPAEYLFICPIHGDNLENDLHMMSHECECFISANRYRVVYDGNGASGGSMGVSVCYYGGASEYEGESVLGDKFLKENTFVKPGYAFAGWSDSPSGQVLFSDRENTSEIERYFAYLSESGEGSDDKEVKLYAIWKKSDCTLNVSGGSIGSSNGSYNGIKNGTYKSGKNSFAKGYKYETYVNPGLLSAPLGYRVKLVVPGGSSLPDMYAGAELSGWRFVSSDNGATQIDNTVGNIRYYGTVSGQLSGTNSSGAFTYIHSSPKDKNTDTAYAVWKSTSIILPDASFPGMVFEGWYTDPDLNPESYVGKKGNIYMPPSDITLYAGFSGLGMTATPDYMGNSTFGSLRYNGLTDLKLTRSTDYDIYKYFISSTYPDAHWDVAHTDDKGAYSGGSTRIFSTGGKYSEYTAAVSGIYSFELWGAAGGSSGDLTGENGEYSSCLLFLNKGDKVGVYTGSAGRTSSGSSGIECTGGEGSYISVNGNVVMSSAGGKGASYSVNVYEEYNYTGTVQSFTAEAEGDYSLQVWGAEGSPANNGNTYQGRGGYAAGEIHLTAGDVLYICVGGSSGYNGGGTGGCDAYGGVGGSGGGATHIAFRSGLLRELESCSSDVCIVAGGGGGSGGPSGRAGAGGGYTGGYGYSPWPDGESTSYGGTQTSAGSGGIDEITNGGFGYGGSGVYYGMRDGLYAIITNGGGGGGWYGGAGGGATWKSYGSGGGGGSGYIGGVTNGSMSDGIRYGDGYALITFSYNVTGNPATGRGTSFAPGSLPYSGHVVKSHDTCVYPAGDTSKTGYCIIKEPAEVLYSSSQCKIYSPDLASPDPVSGARISYNASTGKAEIIWSMPDDNGTEYHYIARAYHASDIMAGRSDRYASTNIEKLNIKTGVYSYYYLIDGSPSRSTAYVRRNGSRILTSWSRISGSSPGADFSSWYQKATDNDKKGSLTYTPNGSDRYIHIIVCDRAGNDSAVFNMAIDGKDAYIPYPVVTRDLTVESSPNVYADTSRSRTYYVRADGISTFSIGYSAQMLGYPRSTYQIDTARIHLSGSDYAEFSFGKNAQVSAGGAALLLRSSCSGAFTMQSFGVRNALRAPGSQLLSFTGDFTTMYEGEMCIYPSAHAHLESGWNLYGITDGLVSSAYSDDIKHGVTLIGDGTAPGCLVSVNGSDYVRLSECNISNVSRSYVVDRRYDEVNIDFYVTDDGAGLKDGFTVNIVNLDNGMEGKYQSGGEHFSLSLKIDPASEESLFENMLFNGRFIISVNAQDRVGNAMSEESAGLTELDVSGEIVRSLDAVTGPITDAAGNRYIKRGESGYVVSRVWGYPEAVLVSFEDESLREYDVLYVTGASFPVFLAGYEGSIIHTDSPEYFLENNTDFTIPLDYAGDSVKVTITAFKGDEVIVWETECEILSEGTVLDELMTVLR